MSRWRICEMGAEPKGKWFFQEEVKIEDGPPPEPRLNGMTAPPEKLMDKVIRGSQKAIRISLTFLTWFIFMAVGVGGTIGFNAIFNHPDYSNIQEELAKEGRATDGELLSEIGRVCQNESKTPYS